MIDSRGTRKLALTLLSVATLTSWGHAAVLFDQMTSPSSTIIPSSWVAPDGTDSDTYSWDNFLLPQNSTVNEVWWVGGGGTPTRLTVRFYTGLAAAPDLQPTISSLPEEETEANYMRGYTFTSPASWNETDFGGGLKQYHVTLPTALDLAGNTVYWLKIEADVAGFPSWGLATATHGRDARHFRYITGMHMFQGVSGSEAFQLRGTAVPEPATMAVMGLGLLVLARRRRCAK